MSTDIETSATTREAIERIEEAYEFMLAYAAQGRQSEPGSAGASQIRGYLERFRASLDTLAEAIPPLLPDGGPGAAFARRFADDVDVAASVIDLLLARDGITSDMIDNTNGLIAMRALLTDLFFVDQVVLAPRGGAEP